MGIVSLGLSEVDTYIQEAKDLAPLKYIKKRRSLTIKMRVFGETNLVGLALNKVTKLMLNSTRGALFANSLFGLFPSLEYLDLKLENANTGHVEPIETKNPKLKMIILEYKVVDPSFYSFIKHAAPNQEALRIRTPVNGFCKENYTHFGLTGWSLKRFALCLYDPYPRKVQINRNVTIQGISKNIMLLSSKNIVLLSPDHGDHEEMIIQTNANILCDDKSLQNQYYACRED